MPRSTRTLPVIALGAIALGGCFTLAACEASSPPLLVPATGVRSGSGPSSRPRPVLAEAPDQLVAADPRLPGFDGWDLAFGARFHDATDGCIVELGRGDAVVRTLDGVLGDSGCTATWDGLDGAGDAVAPGALVATARLLDAAGEERASATSALEVVRLGVDRVELGGERGARAALLYRRTAGLEDGWYEVAASDVPWQLAPDAGEVGGAPLELADGTSRPLPLPSDDVLSPPLDPGSFDGVEHDTFSLPTAWVAGSEITATVRFTSSVAGVPAGGEPQAVEIRAIAPEGTSILGEARFGDGVEILLHTDGSPVPAVGRYDVEWPIAFEARRLGADGPEGEWQPIPGAFPTTHRLYGLVAQPIFDSTAVPYRAWVDVVDRIASWVDGASSDSDTVAGMIIAGIYETANLRYDTARGASFYTEYARGFSGAFFSMQAFEERDNGRIVNCTDSASIASSYMNMVGIDGRYHILTNARGLDLGFDLNYIKAIGMPAFDDTPFDSGRGGFRYHAIVGTRDGLTWDATLAIDGDGAPASPPHVEQLVQGLEAPSYLRALSSQADEIRTDLDEKVSIL